MFFQLLGGNCPFDVVFDGLIGDALVSSENKVNLYEVLFSVSVNETKCRALTSLQGNRATAHPRMRIKQVEMNVSFPLFVKFSPENLNEETSKGKLLLHYWLRRRQSVLCIISKETRSCKHANRSE